MNFGIVLHMESHHTNSVDHMDKCQIKIKSINIKNVGRMPEHQYKVHSKRRDGGGWRGEQIIARSWALPCNITRQRGHSYW